MGTTTRDLARQLEAAERRSALAQHKARGIALAALVLMVGLLVLSLPPMAAQAQKGGSSLETRVAALESQVTTLQSENKTQAELIASLQSTVSSQATQITSLQSVNATQATQISALQSTDTALGGRITPLEAKTAPLSVVGTDFIISGKNVHIVDGSGVTEGDGEGLGNLTIGYNRSRVGVVFGATDVRTGSHNLVVGDCNNYSSYGALVAGALNTISGPYASVSGGQQNTAEGACSSVSGGLSNTARADRSSVSGGYANTASGYLSCVSGGEQNTASGTSSSVSGGERNTASGYGASVSGGRSNTASGAFYASVSGGYLKKALGNYDWVAGTLFEDE